jgi:hypothetical protein
MENVQARHIPTGGGIGARGYTPFVRGLYHGQWITLLTLGILLVAFAALTWAGAAPPGLPMDKIIPPAAHGSAMPVPEAWTQARNLEELCKTALGDHFISFEMEDGTARVDMLAQLTPVYPTGQDLKVNPLTTQTAQRVVAYLIKACYTQFPSEIASLEVRISYPYRDGYGGEGLVTADVMLLTQKDAAALDWRSVTSATLIKQTLQ